MRDYKILDTFEIKDRGTVYAVNQPEKIHTSDLIGRIHRFDGNTCLIRGVETFGGRRDIEANTNVGVLISPVENSFYGVIEALGWTKNEKGRTEYDLFFTTFYKPINFDFWEDPADPKIITLVINHQTMAGFKEISFYNGTHRDGSCFISSLAVKTIDDLEALLNMFENRGV